tara:strand:- start:11840 stop:12091 length:252 start_codon:yes stop_codon:yes gene_type:complete
MGIPGCPEFDFWTASMLKKRIAWAIFSYFKVIVTWCLMMLNYTILMMQSYNLANCDTRKNNEKTVFKKASTEKLRHIGGNHPF